MGKADGILADIGVASTQIDDPSRGFSYRRPGPLDMRMDPTRGQPASQLLQRIPEAELTQALRELGDEEDADKIARLIVKRRAEQKIETTEDLMAIVCEAAKVILRWSAPAGAKLHPAARTISRPCASWVNPRDWRTSTICCGFCTRVPQTARGVAAIISFHSGEDRRVKKGFQGGAA